MPEQQPQLPAQPPLLRELTETAYNLWRHDPITKIFLSYIADKAEDYQDKAMADMLSDDLPQNRQYEYYGRIWCLRELHELPLAGIKELYGIAMPE